MPLLPNELVDSIIKELYGDSQASIGTLRNCALVARTWVCASQRGIFRRIVFRPLDGDASPVVRLISLFDANPRLATYVKRLELNWYPCLGREISNKEEERVAGVINRLSKLEEIMLFNFDWDHIPSALKDTLLGIFRYLSLTKVTFLDFEVDRFANFASLLKDLTRLKSLQVNTLDCRDWSMSRLDAVPNRSLPLRGSIQLIELDLHAVHGQFLAWFQQDSCPFDCRNLRTLRLSDDFSLTVSKYERVASIIQCAGKSLRELELGGPDASLLYMDAIHLGYMPNLRSLKLSNLKQTASHSPAPWIESLFRPVVNSNKQDHPLRSLTIYLTDHYSYNPSDPLQTQWNKWTAVDSIFEKKVFGALEEVVFCYSCLLWQGLGTEELRKLLHKMLPFLAGAGKLRIRVAGVSL